MRQNSWQTIASVRLSTVLAAALSVAAFFSPYNAKGSVDSTKAADLEGLLPPGVEMFHIKYLSIHDVTELLHAFEVEYESIKNYGRTKLFIRFKDPLSAVRARKLLARFDIPPRQIEVHLRQVLASNVVYYEKVDGVYRRFERPIPDEILRNQLKQAFKFKHYHLLGSGRSTSNAGSRSRPSVHVSSRLKLADASGDEALNFASTRAGFLMDFIDEGKGVIQLRDLNVLSLGSHSLNTSLNIKNGETVIVGSSVHEEDDIAIITVVTARTVD